LKTDNYKIMHPDNTVICQVRTSRTAIVDEVEEEDETAEGAEGEEVPATETDDVAAVKE
ncbi:MAG: 50S ribosomal protein L25, partial [Aequorivita vladivostokensis]|nr:50S ribosomal protein L25 [Aequorivita vladivostokensis]